MTVIATKSTKDPMVQAFARAVEQAGGKALLVGGLVRDELLGLESKDYDFEVFGLPMEKVQEIMAQFGNVKEVGQQFGVLNIQELDWDVALPRREMKTGEGHKGFDVVPDPSMTVEEAARRRDLTINALSKDPLTGQIIDPLGGMADLKAGVLRMADPNTFGDDPLRALRVAQFAARFDFDVDPETLKVVAAQPLEELPGERILPEFSKMLLKGKKPSKGIETLRQANLLRYFPEIEALQGVPQDKIHHPEGDVYVHTLMVLDEAGRQRTGDVAFDLPLMLSALAHDFGKPEFTQHVEDRVKSHGHEEGGEAPTREFLQRMKAPNELTDQVSTLVSTHLRPAIMPENAGSKGYRKLGRILQKANVSPELLGALSKADNLGRTTESAIRRDTTRQDMFLSEYKQHVTDSIQPGQKGLVDTVMGKDLIARGMKPGPDMGKFLTLTRAIEDETGLKDPDKIIELATRFLSDRSEGGGSQKKNENDCGDSHIRKGEECFDGDYREQRKKGNTKSSASAPTVSRPCEENEKYPDKCTDEQWELDAPPPAPYQPGEELALPPELEDVPPAPEPQQQVGPGAWELPFSDEELNDPRQQALDEKMLKKTEKDAARKQNAADKAMLKKVQDDQKAQKAAEKAAEQAGKKAAQQEALRQKEALRRGKEEMKENRAPSLEKSKPAPTSDWRKMLDYIMNGPDNDARPEVPSQSSQGPDSFRTHPDPDETDRVLWHDFDWPDKSGETSHHPGLATTAEPARQHKRSLNYQPRWFDSGTRHSERALEGPGSRDGFSGSLPFLPPEQEHKGPPPIPQDEPNWESVNPEPELNVTKSGQEAYFPTQKPAADKGAGFPNWDMPPTYDPKDAQPHPSPMKGSGEDGESPLSSLPGRFQHFPGGGGLDRAPMVKPNGKPKGTGFLPVQNFPQKRNMFKADLLPGGKGDDMPDSNFEQDQLDRGTEDEMDEHGLNDEMAKEIAKDHLVEDEDSYVEGSPKFGRGGQDPNPEIPMVRNRSGKGGHNGDDKSREDFDYDDTGKKPGFLNMKLPKSQQLTKAARTREDLEEIGVIFTKDEVLPINNGGPTVGPKIKHRNERKGPGSATFPGTESLPDERYLGAGEGDPGDIHQKPAQTLIPNQKLAIAIDPKGQPGERIVILQPMFEEVSPAIMALRSQAFEKHGAVVVDGPPLWLLTLEPKLEALDKGASLENSAQLYNQILQLAQSAGLTVDYTQEPRA